MTVYYVSANMGNDDSVGTSAATPLATLQAAANLVKPGDTVEVMNGTYTGAYWGTVLDVTTSGTASAPITFEAAPGQTPVINSSNTWNGIDVQASYVTIKGFTVEGDAAQYSLAQAQAQETNVEDPIFDGNGISVSAPSGGGVPNHDVIENNTVFNEPGGGIAIVGADYIQILNNTVHNNSNYSPYDNSGISIYASVNSDQAAGVHDVVSGNKSYDNANLIPDAFTGGITDGEGIILDTNTNFTGIMEVENNLVYGNSGAGIEAFQTNNAVISGNDAFGNLTNPAAALDGQIFINDSTGVTTTNNSFIPPSGGETVGFYGGVLNGGTFGSGPDVLVVTLSEDYYQGDAQATISIDGILLTAAPLTVTALHSQNQTETFTFNTDLPVGSHQVAVSFINEASGGSPSLERNLYVGGVSLDGSASPTLTGVTQITGTDNFAVTGGRIIQGGTIGTGPDTLLVTLSEQAYNGDAEATVEIDGQLLTSTPITVTALAAAGQTEVFTFRGNFATGTHNVNITLVNFASGGTLNTSRYLTVNQVSIDGSNSSALSSGPSAIYADYGESFSVTSIAALIAASYQTLELAGTTTASTVTVDGTLKLDGIALTATSISVVSGAVVIGSGMVSGPVTSSGLLDANGGNLVFASAVSGSTSLEADSGAALQLAGNAAPNTDGTKITLNGAGSEIEFGSGAPTTIEASLTTIAAGGTLAVLGSRNYSSALALSDSGLLQLAGGTLAPASLTVGSGGKLLGNGTVTPSVANSGTVEANSGTLTLSGGGSGAGALTADAGATLTLYGTTSAGAVTDKGAIDVVNATLTATAVTVASGASLYGIGTVSGTVTDNGLVTAKGGTLKINGAVSGSGALIDDFYSTLELAGTTTVGTVIDNKYGSLALHGITLTATSVTVLGVLYGSGTVSGTVTDNGSITARGGTLKINGAVSGSGALIDNYYSTLELAGNTTVGTVIDNNYGSLSLDGITLTATSVTVLGVLYGSGTVNAPVTNNGVITANGGKLDITGAVTGTGTMQIATGQTLEVGSSVASTQTTVFASSAGLLSLDNPGAYAGSISGFTGSDEIYLGGTVATGFMYNTITDVLTVTNNGGANTIAQLKFNNFTGIFHLSANGQYITDPPGTGSSVTPTFINAAAGNDRIAIPAAGAGVDEISGFRLTNGDVLNFQTALKGSDWDGVLSHLGNFIVAQHDGANTDLYVEPDGNGQGTMVAVLDNVHTSVSSLLAHHSILAS